MKLVPIFTALSLATLALTGCGTKDDATASASTSSASASSASASASSAPSASSVSVAPSTSGDPSEGSQATASQAVTSARATQSSASKEYQPATEQGPAQNVPRPQQPEGMDIESVEGLEKFLNYWFAMRDYAIKTGDVTDLFRQVETSYERDLGFYDFVAETYENDRWIVQAGESKLTLDTSSVETDGEELYSIKVDFSFPDATVYDANGHKTETLEGGESSNFTNEVIARFENGKWSIVDIKEIR